MSVLKVREAAERLKVAPATIYLLCAQGQLNHIRVGTGGRGTIRILEADLAVFVESAMVRTLSQTTARRARKT